MKKRIISLLLADLMLSTTLLFAACGGDTGKTTTPAVTTDANTPADTPFL